MLRIDHSGVGINEVVRGEKGVPSVDEVDWKIIPDLKVTIQP